MPTPRKGENMDEFRARDAARARRWRTIRRAQTLDANGVRTSSSQVQVPEREPFEPMAGAAVVRRSSLLDAENNVIQRWEIEQPAEKARLEAWEAVAKGLTDALPRLPPLGMPVQRQRRFLHKLMAFYPVGDHHTGMLAWKQEAGESYDMEIAENILVGAVRHLVRYTPATQRAVVAFMGDFMHYDSFAAVTPEHKNLLDADGRFSKLVEVSMRLMRRTIEAALEHHAEVDVVVVVGNHDPASMTFMRQALAAIYEKEPRIRVDTSPRHYHYLVFGKNLLGFHHGHGKRAKPEQLPLIMATDQPDAWGTARFRYWFTGHVHHDTVREYPGCRVESLRILAPADAYAAHEGYRSLRDMKAVIFHEEHGEVARHIVNPAMLEDGPV